MLVSVILPCRDEARHLEDCLESVLVGTWPLDELEVLVVDGQSTDGTREVAERFAAAHHQIRVLSNARRTAPAAMNVGLAVAAGDVIVRMDAHVRYPRDYIERLVALLEETKADNVGGRIETVPGAHTVIGRAIARAMSHPFGVGGSQFRLRVSGPRWVDTVPFGCWRRQLFTRIGTFDEELVRNQDDEFNARTIRHGGRVLLDPSIVAEYVARARLRQLGRMYHQYGQFKPLVVRRVGALTSARQLAPLALLAGALIPAAVGSLWTPALLVTVAVLSLYAALSLASALHASREDGIRGLAARVAAFAVMHAAYGWGYAHGLLRLALHGDSPRAPRLLPLSRGDHA